MAKDKERVDKRLSASDALDQQMADSATWKYSQGQTPSREEAAALKRVKKRQDDDQIRRCLGDLPKILYQEASGRSTKVLHEQADRWGLPLRGRRIDLAAVLRRFHDILADYGHKLKKLGADDLDPAALAANLPHLEEKRKWEAKTARLNYELAAKERILRDDVTRGLETLSVVLQQAGDALLRQYGAGAQRILNDCLEDFERNIPLLFACEGEGEGRD